MIKDLLGEILDAKKGKATIVINVHHDKESEKDEMEKQGLAPLLKDEELDKEEDMQSQALMNGEEEDIVRKKKMGNKPKNLSERAKMMAME